MSERGPGPEPASATEQLLRAAADGNVDRVRALLTEGADMNARDQKAWTPLIGAAFFGHHDVVRVLLAAGARADVKDDLDLTALDWSIRRGFTKTARLLRAAAAPDAEPGPATPQEVEHPPGINENLIGRADSAPLTEPRPTGPAVESAPAIATKPVPPAHPATIKYCPVCERTYYMDEARAYCSQHQYPVPLVERGPNAPVVDTPDPASKAKYQLWAMMVVAFLVGGIIGSVIYLYGIRGKPSDAAAQSELRGDYSFEAITASVVNGALKGRESSLPAPAYPEAARNRRRTGSVTVAVTADRSGRVIDARVLDGPPELRSAAEEAARAAKFTRGSPARRSGMVKYDFWLCPADGECAQ